MRVLLVSCFFYLLGVVILLYFKPSFMFDKDGMWKEFGLVQSEKHTWFPVWLFCIVWAIISYALVSFYTCFIDENGISPLASTVPAFFSKSSIIWTTLFFITTNQNIRSKFICSKPPNTNQSQ